jgi:molybdate-binding protein
MAKKRTMNELRQEKNYGYKAPLTHSQKSAKIREGEIDLGYTEIDIETTKDLIFNQLKNELFDIMFQAVNDEMAKHEVFQAETYFTPQGLDEFEDEWFEFYHEHHGDILGSIMKDFTN